MKSASKIKMSTNVCIYHRCVQVSSFDMKMQLPFPGLYMLYWRNQWTLDGAMFSKHKVVRRTWWRTVASGSGDIELISHYAITFCFNFKQLALFLQVVYIVKLGGVTKFCDPAQAIVFIAIKLVYLLLLQLLVKFEDFWDLIPPLIPCKQLRGCPYGMKDF